MQSEQLSRRESSDPFPLSTLLTEKKVEEALSTIHRSVASCQFYPPNHPVLQEAIGEGFAAWRTLESDHRLETVGLRLRGGALWLGDSAVGAANPAVLSLGRTFAGHGLVCLSWKAPLPREGFARLVYLLATLPADLLHEGGLVAAWKVTEFASALQLQTLAVAPTEQAAKAEDSRAASGEGWGEGLSEQTQLQALADPILLARLKAFQQRGPKERRTLELLLRLSRTDDITRFLQLLQEISGITQEYVEAERYREAFHVVLFLYREAQNMDALGHDGKRDYLLDSLRLLLRGAFLQWLIAFVTSARGEEEAEVGEYILRTLGRSAVVPLINALVVEKDRIGRRRLVDVLVAIGEPVVPFAAKMLGDQRWYVVRNMVTILGGVGSVEAVKSIGRLVKDPDNRIRREVARALARVPSPESEKALVTLLDDPDQTVRLMAISAAAAYPSQGMLDVLWRMYRRVRIRSADWNLKASIAQTMGRIGLPEAIAPLETILRKTPFFRRQRWEAVQVAAAQALGELGGEKAKAILERLQSHRREALRKVATRALAGLAEPGKPVEE